MTACRNKARGAVVAALAGALTLGAAPVMALADGASLMATTDTQSINAGTIASFEGGLENGATFVANGEAQGLVPAKVQPWPGNTQQLESDGYVVYKLSSRKDGGTLSTDSTDSYTKARTIDGEAFYYDANYGTDGKTTTLPTEVGEYAVFAKVGKDSVYAGATFSIVAADLEDAEVYQINSKDTDDTTDTAYTFNAGDWGFTNREPSDYANVADYNRFGLKLGDKQLDTSKYTFEYYTADGKRINQTDIKSAGSYYAVVNSDADSVFGVQKARFDFKVDPYDLSAANVVAEDVEWKGVDGDVTSDIATVDGVDWDESWLKNFVTVDYPDVALETGEASLTLNVDKDALIAHDCTEGSITGSKDVSYNVVENLLGAGELTAVYDNEGTDVDFSSTNQALSFDQSKGQAFDASKLTVSYEDAETGKDVETDAYELRVVNKKTQEVGGAEMLAQAGTYEVQVVLDSEALDYVYAGRSAVLAVTVIKGDITSADVAFTYKDEIVTGTAYSGQYLPGYDALDDIDVAVKTKDGKAVPSSDYEVVVTNAKDEVVDSVENVGEYTIEVKAEGYTIDGNTIKVSVDKRDLAKGVEIRAKNTFNYTDDKDVEHRVLQYTGEELTASYEWRVAGTDTWYDLPSADYKVSYKHETSGDDELKTVGKYTAAFYAVSTSENYTVSGDMKITVEVSDSVVFADVPQGEYYTQAVYDANKQGYVFGMGGTNLFMPNKSMSRAEMTVMLYRMAGGVTDNGWEASDTETAYLDRYSDVDATEFYAKALAWATQAGVVRGYEDGTFGPADDVTVEQYVTMLARYAEVKGDYEAVDTDAVLAGVADGSQVSEFGQDAVAWAIDNGYLAQGGADIQPQSPVTRGRAVTVAVRYQPTKASIIGNRG